MGASARAERSSSRRSCHGRATSADANVATTGGAPGDYARLDTLSPQSSGSFCGVGEGRGKRERDQRVMCGCCMYIYVYIRARREISRVKGVGSAYARAAAALPCAWWRRRSGEREKRDGFFRKAFFTR